MCKIIFTYVDANNDDITACKGIMIIKTTIETIETTGFAVNQVAYSHKVVSIVSIVVNKS